MFRMELSHIQVSIKYLCQTRWLYDPIQGTGRKKFYQIQAENLELLVPGIFSSFLGGFGVARCSDVFRPSKIILLLIFTTIFSNADKKVRKNTLPKILF